MLSLSEQSLSTSSDVIIHLFTLSLFEIKVILCNLFSLTAILIYIEIDIRYIVDF